MKSFLVCTAFLLCMNTVAWCAEEKSITEAEYIEQMFGNPPKQLNMITEASQTEEFSEPVAAEKLVSAEPTTIEKRIGEKITIELPANLSTGYTWYWLVDQPYYQLPVSLIKRQYKLSKGAPRVGAGGTLKFIFKAMRTGTTTILLYNKRGWEKNTDIDMRRYQVTIIK